MYTPNVVPVCIYIYIHINIYIYIHVAFFGWMEIFITRGGGGGGGVLGGGGGGFTMKRQVSNVKKAQAAGLNAWILTGTQNPNEHV